MQASSLKALEPSTSKDDDSLDDGSPNDVCGYALAGAPASNRQQTGAPTSSGRLMWTPRKRDCPSPYRVASIKGLPLECHALLEAAGLSETIGDWGSATVQPEEPAEDASAGAKIAYLDYQLDSLRGLEVLGGLTILERVKNRRHGGAQLLPHASA